MLRWLIIVRFCVVAVCGVCSWQVAWAETPTDFNYSLFDASHYRAGTLRTAAKRMWSMANCV